MHDEYPELLKDQYWDKVVPDDLPYTIGSEHDRKPEPKGSAENYKVKQVDTVYANVMQGKRYQQSDDIYADYVNICHIHGIVSIITRLFFRKVLIHPYQNVVVIG